MHPEELEQRCAANQRGSLALETTFPETADPHSYVARDATEEVLAQLLSSVIASRGPVVFNAKPGMGKTILLHVLAERLVGHARCVFLPYGALSLEDLCAWSLGRMGEARGRKPVRALLSIARQLAEHGQVLTLRHTPEQDSVYYAYFAPYSMERHSDLIADCLESPEARLEVLGRTLDGQDLDLLTIGKGAEGKRSQW